MSILPDSFIQIDDLENIVTEITEEPEYKKTYAFDYEKGDFVTDSMNRIVEINTPGNVLTEVVNKILHDARYKYLIYSSDYGNEIDSLLKQDEEYEIFALELERIYEESLIYHPLIESISEFSIERQDDKVFCKFYINGYDDTTILIQEEVSY